MAQDDYCIYRDGRRINMSALKRQLLVRLPQLEGWVDRLAGDWVISRAEANNRRKVIAELTAFVKKI